MVMHRCICWTRQILLNTEFEHPCICWTMRILLNTEFEHCCICWTQRIYWILDINIFASVGQGEYYWVLDMSTVASVGQGEYWQTAKPLLMYSYVHDFWQLRFWLNVSQYIHNDITSSLDALSFKDLWTATFPSSPLLKHSLAFKAGLIKLPYESQLMFFSTCFKVDSTPFLLKRFVCECGSNAKLEVAWLPLTNDRALNWSAFHEGWRKACKWPTIDKRNAQLQNMISLINIDL